jgi:hypothetical protein
MRYHSLSPTPADPCGGATAPADIRANEGVAMGGKHLELTLVLVVVKIEVGKSWGGLPTCGRTTRRRSGADKTR